MTPHTCRCGAHLTVPTAWSAFRCARCGATWAADGLVIRLVLSAAAVSRMFQVPARLVGDSVW